MTNTSQTTESSMAAPAARIAVTAPKREARAERMALAIEAALPLIDEMWGQFPYAADETDDLVMSELREAVQAFRRLQAEERAYFGI